LITSEPAVVRPVPGLIRCVEIRESAKPTIGVGDQAVGILELGGCRGALACCAVNSSVVLAVAGACVAVIDSGMVLSLAVTVSGSVVCGGAGDAVACEGLGDGVQALAGDVFAKNPLDDRSGGWVGF
jgi:hypothetical protein